jgi:hypothetical protein
MKNICAKMVIRMAAVGKCDERRNMLITFSKIAGRKNSDW